MRTIDSINNAMRTIKKTFGSNSEVYNHILNTLSGIENLQLTNSLYISKKTEDKLALEAADSTVKNVTKWLDYAKKVIDDNNADADDRSEMIDIPTTKDELVKATNTIVGMLDEYAASLSEFYDIKKEISSSVIDMSDDDRNRLKGLVADISMSISHPGQWALPANRIRQNENKIDNLRNHLETVKERQYENS